MASCVRFSMTFLIIKPWTVCVYSVVFLLISCHCETFSKDVSNYFPQSSGTALLGSVTNLTVFPLASFK